MERLDKIISKKLEIPRSVSKKIIEDGFVSIKNYNKKIKPNLNISLEEEKNIIIDDEYKEHILKENIKEEISKDILESIKIVYEDEYIYIINKPAGIIVESETTKENTLVDILKAKGLTLSKSYKKSRDGIVHRLDKDTSGLLIITKTKEANDTFLKEFKERKINKIYTCIVKGNPKQEIAKIDMPIKRDEKNRTKMFLSTEGKEAISRFKVLKRYKDTALLNVRIYTGRTHQIRVHLAGINHPILGDDKYGSMKNKYGANRQMLHASELSFLHPFLNKEIDIEVDLPEDFKKVIKNIEELE